MNIDEMELLREQVRIQAEMIAALNFDLSRYKAITAILAKPKEPKEDD